MKRLPLVPVGSLKSNELAATVSISRHARLLCQAPPFSWIHPQRLFSHSTRRTADSLAYTKYSLPPKGRRGPVSASASAATMDGAREAAGPVAKRTAYIALGSNMGDRIGWIEKACNEMDARGIKVKRTSSLWETEPMYVLDQDRFINGVCEVCAGLRFFFFFFALCPSAPGKALVSFEG